MYVVISELVFLMLEPDPKMKGVGKLVSWGTLPTIDNIKRNLDNPDFLTITWRKVDFKDPWILNILLPNNANDCVNLILKHLKKQGLVIDKKYEKKKKLLEKVIGYLKTDSKGVATVLGKHAFTLDAGVVSAPNFPDSVIG